LVGLVSVLTALLGKTILTPISEVGSFTCAVGWLATCAAFCYGAAGKLKPADRIVGWAGAAMAAGFIVIVVYGFGKYEWLATAAWAFCGWLLWRRAQSAPSGSL